MGIDAQVNSSASLSSGGSPLSGTARESGTTLTTIDQVIPANQTDLLVPCSFVVANLQQITIVADQNMTIETNSGGSPANTINLKAGRPFVWNKSDGYFPNQFTTNVTAWYITNTTAGRLQAKILVS